MPAQLRGLCFSSDPGTALHVDDLASEKMGRRERGATDDRLALPQTWRLFVIAVFAPQRLASKLQPQFRTRPDDGITELPHPVLGGLLVTCLEAVKRSEEHTSEL